MFLPTKTIQILRSEEFGTNGNRYQIPVIMNQVGHDQATINSIAISILPSIYFEECGTFFSHTGQKCNKSKLAIYDSI
jgi:hypothetical protein